MTKLLEMRASAVSILVTLTPVFAFFAVLTVSMLAMQPYFYSGFQVFESKTVAWCRHSRPLEGPCEKGIIAVTLMLVFSVLVNVALWVADLVANVSKKAIQHEKTN